MRVISILRCHSTKNVLQLFSLYLSLILKIFSHTYDYRFDEVLQLESHILTQIYHFINAWSAGKKQEIHFLTFKSQP